MAGLKKTNISPQEQKKLCEELTQALKSPEAKKDAKYAMRLRVVLTYLQGACAKCLISPGVSESSIYNWLSKVRDPDQGIASLRNNSYQGSKSRLNDQQLKQLKAAIMSDPHKFGYDVWKGSSIADFIKTKFGVSLCVSQCYKIMRDKLKLSYTRARMFPTNGKDNTLEQAEFKKKLREHVAEGDIIVAQDEVHFKQMSTMHSSWSPIGETQLVASSPSQRSIGFSGFAILNDGSLIMEQLEKFTYATVIESFRSLLKKAPLPKGKKYVMIIDNAPWHRKALRLIAEDKQYADLRDAFVFLRLPPYCPHLNPIEQCWRIARYKLTHNRYFKTFESLKKELVDYFDLLAAPSKELRQLLQFKWMNFS